MTMKSEAKVKKSDKKDKAPKKDKNETKVIALPEPAPEEVVAEKPKPAPKAKAPAKKVTPASPAKRAYVRKDKPVETTPVSSEPTPES